MVVFLLKSSACLAVFLMFYKLFLEKERMHTFKRFYLLAALVFSLLIPSITFVEYIEVTPAPALIAPVENIVKGPAKSVYEGATATEVNQIKIDYWPIVLWMVYGLGVLLFALKFFFNLWKIVRNIRNNPKLKIQTIINVLLRDTVVPHTFLNYIFLNRQKFEAHKIPKDVLVHEATHARQKHSLDVLLVELLQIVFWFNPLIHLAKKSIKLNHEFLADAAVLQQGSTTTDYQNILLAFASSANYKCKQPSMANAINYSSYSSIKKRFTVMKTRTSKKSILVRSLLLLPLFALLLYGFSESRIIEINKKSSMPEVQIPHWDDVKILINKKGQLLVQNELVAPENLASFLSQLNAQLSKTEREKTITAVIITDNSAPMDVITEVKNILNEYGVARINFQEPETLPPPSQNGATNKQLAQYDIMAKKYNAQPKVKRVIPSEDLKILEHIYRKMSEDQKANAQPFPECPDPKSGKQEGANEKQMAEYNALAKEYNKMLDDNRSIRINKSDVNRLEYLHSIMSEEQRAVAEPFPDFPEPPEPPVPPVPPSTPDLSEKQFAENRIKEIIENQDPYDGFNLNVMNPMTSPSLGDKKTIREIIAVESANPPSPPSPSLPNQNSGKINQWALSSGANRDTRNTEDSTVILPVVPTIAVHVDRVKYSKELKSSIKEYLEANKSYEKAVSDYRENGNDNTQNLWNLYNAAMEKYVAYHVLAKEEGYFVQPVLANTQRHKGEKNIPPAPPTPQKPKSPLELLKALKKDNVKIRVDGKQVGYEEAKKLFKESTFTRVNVSEGIGKRPVLSVWTN